jgi:hypothetical protein
MIINKNGNLARLDGRELVPELEESMQLHNGIKIVDLNMLTAVDEIINPTDDPLIDNFVPRHLKFVDGAHLPVVATLEEYKQLLAILKGDKEYTKFKQSVRLRPFSLHEAQGVIAQRRSAIYMEKRRGRLLTAVILALMILATLFVGWGHIQWHLPAITLLVLSAIMMVFLLKKPKTNLRDLIYPFETDVWERLQAQDLNQTEGGHI